MTHRIAADVGLVEDRAFPRDLRPSLFAPCEGRINDAAFRHERRAVALVERKIALGRTDGIAKQGIVPLQLSNDLLAIGVEKKLVVVEAVTRRRRIGAVHAVAIDLTRPSVRKIAVPNLVGIFRKFYALDLLLAFEIEKAELHLGGVGREQREIDAKAVPGRSQREGTSLLYPVPGERQGRHRSVKHRHLIHTARPRIWHSENAFDLAKFSLLSCLDLRRKRGGGRGPPRVTGTICAGRAAGG